MINFVARTLTLAMTCALLAGCSTKQILKADNADLLLKSNEFDQKVEVKELAPDDTTQSGTYVRLPGPAPVPGAFMTKAQQRAAEKKAARDAIAAAKASGKKGKALQAAQPTLPSAPSTPSTSQALAALVAGTGMKHEPSSIEDTDGFFGRRPTKDPYRVGEKVTYEVSYFAVVGGDMTAEVRNFVEVNGRRAYRFAGTAKSSSVFAMFYAVDDWFETFVDYDSLIPQSYALHVKESKQLRETRTVFDWSTHKANYYDKKINEEKKLEQDNKEWEIPDYSQNVFSAAFYLRAFTWRPGMKTSFRVAHEGKNLLLTAEYVRKDKMSVADKEYECIVVKPTISLDGKFTPIGDVFVWMTDDDRKLILRIESKIKIGKIIAVAKSLELGKP